MTGALIPGRILVVDDVYEDVADIIQEFRDEGYGVIYRDGPSDDISRMSNIRLVLHHESFDMWGSFCLSGLYYM